MIYKYSVATKGKQFIKARQKMLFISRKLDESVIINNNIELKVLEIRGRTVKLGFNFPKEASVLRKELYDKIMAENLAAARSGASADDFAKLMGSHKKDENEAGFVVEIDTEETAS